jgi:hypothetical protein
VVAVVLLGEGYALTRIGGDFVSVGAYFEVYGLFSRGILNMQMFFTRLETTSYTHERTHMPPQRPSGSRYAHSRLGQATRAPCPGRVHARVRCE